MPRDEKLTRAAAILSLRVLIVSICFNASYRFDRHQGFLTAVICFDAVIEEQSPLGTSAKRPKTYLSLSALLNLLSLFQGHELISNFYW